MEKIIESLLKMGYREYQIKNVYAKPVAFHLFVFNIDTLEWINFFGNTNSDKPHIWSSCIYNPDATVKDDFLRHLKYCELETGISTYTETNFDFLTKEQYYNILMDT